MGYGAQQFGVSEVPPPPPVDAEPEAPPRAHRLSALTEASRATFDTVKSTLSTVASPSASLQQKTQAVRRPEVTVREAATSRADPIGS